MKDLILGAGKQTVLFSDGKKLWAADIKEQGRKASVFSYLCFSEDKDGEKEKPPEGIISFLSAHHMSIRHICLVIPLEQCRMKRIRFPSMTHQELDDTFQWEKERLFHSRRESLFDYDIVSENEEGYDLLAYSCSEEVLTAWKDRIIGEGGSAPSFIPEAALLTAFFDGRSGMAFRGTDKGLFIIFFHRGQWIDQQYISAGHMPQTPEQIRDITDPVCRVHGMNPSLYIRIPMPGQGGSPFCWEKDQSAYPFSLMNDSSVSQAFSKGERAFLSSFLALFPYIPVCRRKHFFFHLPAGKRFQQIIHSIWFARASAAGVLLFFLLSVFSFGNAWTEKERTEEAWQNQEEQREEMRIYGEKRKQNEAVREEIALLEKQSFHWEQKMAEAADILPAGIVFRSVTAESSGIQIEGTAARMADLMTLQKRIAWAWGGKAVISSASQKEGMPLISYSLRWSPSETETERSKVGKKGKGNDRI